MLQRLASGTMNLGSIDRRRSSMSAPFTVAGAGGEVFGPGLGPLPPKLHLVGGGTQQVHGMAMGGTLKTNGHELTGKMPLNKVLPTFNSSKTPDKTPVDGKKTRRKKKWKKPKDKPNRPLSAYNLFFAQERSEMLGDDAPTAEQEALKKRIHCKTHGKIPFAVMARTIGAKWKMLEAETKKPFEEKAAKLKEKYLVELNVWKDAQKEKADAEAAAQAATQTNLDAMATAALHHHQGHVLPSLRTNTETMAASHAALMANRMSMPHAGGPMGMSTPMGGMANMEGMGEEGKNGDPMRFFIENGMNGVNGMNGMGGMQGHGRRTSQMHQVPPAPDADYIRAMQDRPIDKAAMFGMSAAGPAGPYSRQSTEEQHKQQQQQQQQSMERQQNANASGGNQSQQQQQNWRQQYEQHPNFAAEASANALMMSFQDGYTTQPRSTKTSNRRGSSGGSDEDREPTPRERQHAAMLAERERFQHFANMRRLQQRAFMAGGFINMNGL